MRARRPDVVIVTSGHDVADARLHREVAALLRVGLTVQVRGLGDVSGGPPGADVHVRPRRAGMGRILTAVRAALQARGDVLITLDPDAALTCASLARWRRSALVVDVHEDYGRLLLDRGWARGWKARAAQLGVRLATAAAARADLTVVADDHVPPAAARQRLVVPNVPDATMIPAGGAPADAPLRAVYVGDLRETRGLYDMVEAVAGAPDWSLDLVGPMSEADGQWLARRLQEGTLAARVTWHDRLPPRAAWQVASRAQVGLSLLHPTPAFVAAMPSKVYEYLACGLAVLSSPLPRVVELLDESGAGEVVSSADAAAAVLTRWAGDRAELARVQAGAAARGAVLRAAGNAYDGMARRVAELAAVSARGRRASGPRR